MTWGSIPIGWSEGTWWRGWTFEGRDAAKESCRTANTPSRSSKTARRVIAWLAAQSWSNGSVGMMGISWGGFNSIQMAMRQPPALKAIIAVDATEDLFKDDIHYIDGLMHADEYELSMDLQPAMTRPPDFPIDESSLRARFDAKPWFPIYLEHQRGGPFGIGLRCGRITRG